MMKLTVNIKVSVDTSRLLTAAMKALEENQVLVGIPAEKAPRTSSEAKATGAKINNAALGYIHNFGSPAQNIPARQFLEPGIKDAQDGITVRMTKAAQGALDGQPDVVKNNLNAVGIIASSSVKLKINSNIPPPLGASTLAARRRRGRTGTHTLVDTGQLRNSISYVIRPRK